MRLIIALGLLFVILSVAGYVFASPSQSCECPAMAAQSVALACPNAQIVTATTTQLIFSNPHSGWVAVPVEEKFLRCPAQL